MIESVQDEKPADARVVPGFGFLLISTGKRFNRAAHEAARNIRRHMPGAGIALFTDDPAGTPRELFDHVEAIANPHYRSKVDYLTKTPFERTLYIDTDVRILDPLDDLFALLDKFELAIGHAHARYRPETQSIWRKALPNAFPQLNCGVILYKKTDAVWSLLHDWETAFHAAKAKKDQLTFRELLWDSEVSFYVFPPEYNFRYKKYLNVWARTEAQPKILHLREFHDPGRPWTRNLKDRIKEFIEEAGFGIALTWGAFIRLFARRGKSI